MAGSVLDLDLMAIEKPTLILSKHKEYKPNTFAQLSKRKLSLVASCYIQNGGPMYKNVDRTLKCYAQHDAFYSKGLAEVHKECKFSNRM